MGFLRNILTGKKSAAVPRTYVDGATWFLTDRALASLLNDGLISARILTDTELIDAYSSLSECFSPVDHIAKRVSDVKFIAVNAKTGQPVTDDKYINQLLTQPNPLQTFSDFIYQSIAYELVTGKNFTHAYLPEGLSFNYRNIVNLVNLPPDLVSIRLASANPSIYARGIEDVIIGYNFSGFPLLKTENVLYSRAQSLRATDYSNVLGFSPLNASAKAVELLNIVYQARNVIYRKRGALGFLTSGAKDDTGAVALTPQEKQAAIDELNKMHGLASHQSPIGVIQAPVSFVKVSADIKDLMPHEEMQLLTNEIASVLRVPRELVDVSKSSTYENQKQAEVKLYQSVIIPAANNKANELTNFLRLGDRNVKIVASFDHIAALHEDKKAKAETDKANTETYKVQYFMGQRTLNDIRALLGLEKVKNNAVYDKLVFDLSPDELANVDKIMRNVNTTQTQP